MLVPVAHATSDPEAELIRAQLADADIPCVSKGGNMAQIGFAGASGIYVEESLAERAREVLAMEPVSDEELARLSDAAGHEKPVDGIADDLPKSVKRYVRQLPAYGFEQIGDVVSAGERLIVFRRSPIELRIVNDHGRWSVDVTADAWPEGDRVPLLLCAPR
jgi:hypothetical protein